MSINPRLRLLGFSESCVVMKTKKRYGVEKWRWGAGILPACDRFSQNERT